MLNLLGQEMENTVFQDILKMGNMVKMENTEVMVKTAAMVEMVVPVFMEMAETEGMEEMLIKFHFKP